MQRRDFVKALGLLPFAVGASELAFAAAPAGSYRNLLILIELRGGNDGLNTLVPYADPAYYRLRPRIAVARDAVLQLDERVGLHPSLEPLLASWRAGELAAIQGIGYPEPNLSHFRSIEIWDTASRSDEYLQDGWLARAFAARPLPPRFVADGVVVGANEHGPLAGARAIALTNPEQFKRQARLAEAMPAEARNPALAHIRKVEAEVRQAAAGLVGETVLATEFPRHAFGQALRAAAQVVASGADVAAIRVSHNGYDTHGNQPATHTRLLRELAEGLVALRAALAALDRWNSTLVLTYGEFGRRAAENGSNGTDHGTANVQFALGGRVKGGLLGQAPSLARLENGNLVHSVDFRALYATVIETWWGQDARAPLNGRFAPLDLIRA